MDVELFTIWVRYEGSEDAVGLIDAWDEFSIDENPSGYEEALKKAQSDNAEVRVVVIRISHDAVVKAFQPKRIDGGIRP